MNEQPRQRRSIRAASIRSLTGMDKGESMARNGSFIPRNKGGSEFTLQNSLNIYKNQKCVDILEKIQKELIDYPSEDISKLVITWLAKQSRKKDKMTSISFTPHTLQIQEVTVDEQRIPRIVETIKQLIMITETYTGTTEQLESKTYELIEKSFLTIYTRIENAFDEESTVDISEQNGYIFLKGKRAFNLLREFCSIFSENEPIYKIFPMSKSESFGNLLKFNQYIKKYILEEDDGSHQSKPLKKFQSVNKTNQIELNMEKINIFFTLITRLQCSLETLTKGFKSHAQALEGILKKIINSDMILPFYDTEIDFSSSPEEATTSISMSKGNTLTFQDAQGKKKGSGYPDGGQQGDMEMIQESDEDEDEDENDENLDYKKNGQSKEDSEGAKNRQQRYKRHDKDDLKLGEQEQQEMFSFQIEYLKPGNIPWDIQTIRSEGKIGSGGQGTVFKAFDPTKERQIALKFTNLPYNWESQKDDFLQEIRIQSFMTFEKMKRILEVDNKVYIYQDKYGQQQMYLISLMELGVGSLEDFLKLCQNDKKYLTDQELFNIFFDILEGLDAMHKSGFAHKDIKPQNVIYTIKDKSWKIADFGCIQKLEEEENDFPSPTSNLNSLNFNVKKDKEKKRRFLSECFVTGTPTYMSPELYSLYQQRQETGPVNLIANDYYSLGITLLKLRNMEKVERAKLSQMIMLNKLSHDHVSQLISILLNEDQVFRSQLSKQSFINLFSEEYQIYVDKQPEDYLESVFKYDENAQDNFTLSQKLECAKTYQNVNLREKCLRFFDEAVTDPEFEKLDIFEKRNILVEQAQALSFFGDYDRAYEQQIKCIQISSEKLKGFKGNELVVADLKFLGQILFNQGNYDQALQKYLQVLQIIQEGHVQKTEQISKEGKSSPNFEASLSDSYSLKKKVVGNQPTSQLKEKEKEEEIKEEFNVMQSIVEDKQKDKFPKLVVIKPDELDSHSKTNDYLSFQSSLSKTSNLNQTLLDPNQRSDLNPSNFENISIGSVGNSSVDCQSQSQRTVELSLPKYFINEYLPNGKKEPNFNSEASSLISIKVTQAQSPIKNEKEANCGSPEQKQMFLFPKTNNTGNTSNQENVQSNSSLLTVPSNAAGDFALNSPNSEVVLQAMKYDNSLSNTAIEQYSEEIQNELAQIQMFIGQALNKLGHYDKALKYYEQALRTMEHNLGKDDTSVAFILDSMGESLLNNGKYKESFRMFKRSYKIKRAEFGKNSVHLAETVNSMGKVLEKLTLYEKSAQHYEKALHIFEQHYGHNHIKTAEILNNLGCVKRAEGDYKEAYKMFKEVLSITSNHYPSDHIELGKIYHDIGNVLRNQENLELSLEYFLKAKEIKMKHYGANHVEVSNTCQYIGIIYRKMEKIELAQQYFELALGPMESHYGKDHIEVVKLVQEIAVLMQIQGLDLLAKEKLEFVLENRVQEFGKFHIKTANTMQNVAVVEMELGNYFKSLEYNLVVLEVRKKTFGESHLKVANSHTSIAQLHELIGNYEKANSSLEEAMNIYNLDLDTNKSKIQSANLIKARILLNTFQLQKVQVLLEEDLIPQLKQESINFAQAHMLLSHVYSLQNFILQEDIRQWVLTDQFIVVNKHGYGTKHIGNEFIHRISKRTSEEIESKLAIAKTSIESSILHYEKNFGKEHYLYAQILEQKALLNKDPELARTALIIKLKRFEESHIEIVNTQEILCGIEFDLISKQHDNDNTNTQNKNLLTEIEQKLKILENLRIAFYSNDSSHISLLKAHLLLYRITQKQEYKDSIFRLLTNKIIDLN